MKTKLIKNNDTLKFSPYQLAKLEDLLVNGKSFVDDPRFKDKNFSAKLMSYKGPVIDTSWFFNHMNSIDGLDTSCSESVILNSKQEELLFLKYNYIKKTLNSLCTLNVSDCYERMLELEDSCNKVKDQLAGANLSMLLKIARRNTFSFVDFSEAVGEGNMTLIDCIEKFDVSKAKFSTYFTRSFNNALIRLNNSNKKISSNSIEYDSSLHDRVSEKSGENNQFLKLINEFISGDKDLLNDDERFVLRKKYVEGLTLDSIGKLYSPIKTKGQVFYVEKNARLKIKDALTDMLEDN